MVTQLRESLDELRLQIAICKSESSSALSRGYSKKIIESEWKTVQLYRSDKPMQVLLVKGLYERDMYFRNYEDLGEVLESVFFEEGMKFTVEVVTMTGCKFGRLPVLEL